MLIYSFINRMNVLGPLYGEKLVVLHHCTHIQCFLYVSILYVLYVIWSFLPLSGTTTLVSDFKPCVILTLSPERQSARMSKITNDGLTRSGTGCFIAVPIWQQ